MDWSKVDEAISSAVVPYDEDAEMSAHKCRHVFPGCVLLVGLGGKIVYHKAFGCRSLLPKPSPMNVDVVFDIASLTKAIVTTTLVMQLVDKKLLTIDRRLSRILQTFGTHGKERITVRHLLNHTSGYPAIAPFYKHIAKLDNGARSGVMTSRGAVDTVYMEICRSKLENLPGKVTKYSDIGFLLLGHVVEVINGGMTLDKLAQQQIFKALKLRNMGYVDLALLKRQGLAPNLDIIAPTAECPWRGRILCGEVHDDNAWVMGGVAAHSGMFSTARDIHTFALEMIRCWQGQGTLVKRETIRRFWTVDGMDPKSTWGLGWDTPDLVGSSSGQYFSPSSVGHLGFTGCSLWIDPDREVDVILLSNRIHPSVENNAIRDFRPVIHDLVMETLGFSC